MYSCWLEQFDYSRAPPARKLFGTLVKKLSCDITPNAEAQNRRKNQVGNSFLSCSAFLRFGVAA